MAGSPRIGELVTNAPPGGDVISPGGAATRPDNPAVAGGRAVSRRSDVGWPGPGARSDLIMLDGPSQAYLAYRPGVPLIRAVCQSGQRIPLELA